LTGDARKAGEGRDDAKWMRAALAEAKMARSAGEVPVGAVVVKDGAVIGRGHNQVEGLKDPTAHAEILAIGAAATTLGSWRLEGATLYVTLEPCTMCAGAIVLSRVARLVFGASDPKAGACGSLMNVPRDERLNHLVEIDSGFMEEECSFLLRSFFEELRKKKEAGAG
jgi:tRNA(adenine34) deaminase